MRAAAQVRPTMRVTRAAHCAGVAFRVTGKFKSESRLPFMMIEVTVPVTPGRSRWRARATGGVPGQWPGPGVVLSRG